jgi:hypothetical protein
MTDAWRINSRLGACGHPSKQGHGQTRLRGLGRMLACMGWGVRAGGLGGGTPLGAVLTASGEGWQDD